MHFFILTGTSRGIGAALAEALLSPEHVLFCISRSDNPELRSAAVAENCRLRYLHADLSQSFDTQHLMQVIFSEIDLGEAQSLTLVHNAGLLTPIGLVGGEMDAEDLVQSVNVNLLSPMLMTQTFVSRVQDLEIPKKLLFISSGAARKARAGWGAYCSTKAGMEMYAQCLAEEQQEQQHPVRVVSLAPGVVDTSMQDLIRRQNEENFPSIERFRELKTSNALWEPEFVAHQILLLLQEADFGKEVVMDLRDRVEKS